MAAYCRLRHVGRLRRAALFSTVKTSVRGKQPVQRPALLMCPRLLRSSRLTLVASDASRIVEFKTESRRQGQPAKSLCLWTEEKNLSRSFADETR